MRAISLWQPWASLCCLPHPDDPARSVKGFETRSWPTSYRGPLLIHAAKRFTRDQRDWCFQPLIYEALASAYKEDDRLAGFNLDKIPTGAIIGQVTVTGCYPSERAAKLADDYALAMGNYGPGRYAWEMHDPVLFDVPVPYRGQQGFFDVPRGAFERTEEARSTRTPDLFSTGDPR